MKYDAFISYSHAVDGELAPALQQGLHKFAKPWNRRRAMNVFRDETGLVASPELWASIEEALEESEYFVLMASPTAASSEWVAKEVAAFLERSGSAEKVLIALTEGSLVWDGGRNDFDWDRTDSIPAPLRGAFNGEPRYIDLTWARDEDSVDLKNPLFAERIADLAAPIRGVSRDEIIGEDLRQHRRTVVLTRTAAAVVAALAIFSLVAGISSFVLFGSQRSAVASEARLAAEATAGAVAATTSVAVQTVLSASESTAVASESTAVAAQSAAVANATVAGDERDRAIRSEATAISSEMVASAAVSTAVAARSTAVAIEATSVVALEEIWVLSSGNSPLCNAKSPAIYLVLIARSGGFGDALCVQPDSPCALNAAAEALLPDKCSDLLPGALSITELVGI
jgi:TIR domain